MLDHRRCSSGGGKLLLLPAGRSHAQGREDERQDKKGGAFGFRAPHQKWSYAAVRFAALAGTFMAFVFSLAASACLTLEAMASVSTL